MHKNPFHKYGLIHSYMPNHCKQKMLFVAKNKEILDTYNNMFVRWQSSYTRGLLEISQVLSSYNWLIMHVDS